MHSACLIGAAAESEVAALCDTVANRWLILLSTLATQLGDGVDVCLGVDDATARTGALHCMVLDGHS